MTCSPRCRLFSTSWTSSREKATSPGRRGRSPGSLRRSTRIASGSAPKPTRAVRRSSRYRPRSTFRAGLETRRRGNQKSCRRRSPGSHQGQVPSAVPWPRVLLVGAVLFLVNDDQAQVPDGSEDRGPGADDDSSLAVANPPPTPGVVQRCRGSNAAWRPGRGSVPEVRAPARAPVRSRARG